MKLATALLLACSFSTLAQTPAAKRPMTFADLMAMKRVSDPQISPSGKWVLFSVTDVSLEKNSKTNHLWAVPLDGSAKEVQLTSSSGESNGRFSPDGKWVMYSSSEGGSSQIWLAPWDEAKGTVSAGHAVTALETEADGAIWAPDSQHILFTSGVYPDCESKLPWPSAATNRSATADPSAATQPSAATHQSVVKGTASAVPSQHKNDGALASEASLAQRNEEEANCNALKDAVATKNPVKAQIFDHLLYRHWNAYVGPKHSHIFYADTRVGAPLLASEKWVPKAPTDLTPASVIGDHEAPTFSLGGPLGYAISPDGKEIAYVTNLDKVPAESTNNDIFTLLVGADPHTAKKVSTSPGSDDGPQYSPDGKYLAWRSQARNGYESDKYDLLVTARATGINRKLTTNFDSWIDEFSWAPDSKSTYIGAQVKGRGLIFRIAVQESAIAELTYTCKVVRGPCSHVDLGGVQASPDGKALVMTSMSVDSPSNIVVANIAQEDSNKPWYQNPCSGCWGEVERDDSQRQWFVSKEISPLLATVESLTHINDNLTGDIGLQPLESFWFPGANGTKVEGFLVKPPNLDPAKKYPVKFLIHGGPQGAWGDAWSYRWNPELFAANGYVVVMVNPRGSTGYGQKFLEQVSGDWGGRSIEDLTRGLDYAEQHYPFIDKNRECALGASYGGFAANWLLTHTDRFKCIVTHDGMYNPQSAFGTTEELWFNEWEFRPLAGDREKGIGKRKAGADGGAITAGSAVTGKADSSASLRNDNKDGRNAVVEQTHPAHPWDFYDKPASQDPFRKWSPMLNIKNAHTPTLVIHGQRDYRLDVSEGFQLFTALQLLNVPSKMLYFPDEGHWVLKPKNSELWYETVNDWCDRWTGTNKYASLGPEKNPLVQGEGNREEGTGKAKLVRESKSPAAQTKDRSDE